MSLLADLLIALQAALVAALALFGWHRGFLVWLHARTRHTLGGETTATTADPARARPAPALHGSLPTVTVQLPIYNEAAVVARLLHAVALLDYPRDRLQVQVLDDSTDETSAIVANVLAQLPSDLAITHVRRGDRAGFKAGALAHGLRRSTSELIAVFDADFVPPADFLVQLAPVFGDERVGMVQARWEHLNPTHNLLTSMQRLLLDGHFVIEHWARAATGRFFNFNGTAGVFRRACIEEAGGWQHDTLTEDLDLSYRAQLGGWRFVYRPDAACPAELPVRMNDFLGQQHRWAKGAVQTARKILPRLLRSPLPLRTKVEAGFHLLGNVGFLVLLGLMLVTLPLQAVRWLGHAETPRWFAILEGVPLGLSLLCVLAHYGVAQSSLRRFDLATLVRLPLVLALGAGMTVNATAAFVGGLGRRTGEFNRTPKVGAGSRHQLARNPRGALPWLEVGLGLWCATTASLSARIDQPWTAAFHGLFAVGLFWVGLGSLCDDLRAPIAAPAPIAPQPEPTT